MDAAVRGSGACSAVPPWAGESKPGLCAQEKRVLTSLATDALKRRARAPPELRMFLPLPQSAWLGGLCSGQHLTPL